jgi:hypothetical protein
MQISKRRTATVTDMVNIIHLLSLDTQMRIVIGNPEVPGGNITFMPRDGIIGNEPEILLLDNDENKVKALEFRYRETLGRSRSLMEFFVHVNKPYRLILLHHVSRVFEMNGEFEKILSYAWTSAEFPHQMPIPHIKELFEMADRDKLMDADDRKKFDALPDEITVYRGLQDEQTKRRGLSWTTDKSVAYWFATRWKSEESKVLQATVLKSKVYMYTDGRNERECVLNPSCLKNVRQIS